MEFFRYSTVFLGMIESEAGAIVGPISVFFGAIINFIFNIVAAITPVGTLGISIILMTFVVRTAMLPMQFKMQKNQIKMQELKPEIDKIKEKYKDARDPELKRKMNVEIQQLYSTNGVNMLASCLPMLVLMPIFFALMYIMRHSHMFISGVGDVYSELSNTLIYDTFESTGELVSALGNLVQSYLPAGMPLDIGVAGDLNRAIAVFSDETWAQLFAFLNETGRSAEVYNIQNMLAAKNSIETFLGINLVANSGLAWPGIVIPILSAGTMIISTLGMMRKKDAEQMPGQKAMMYAMPLMMGFFTITVAAGVGVYWIASNVYQVGQQHFIGKYYKSERYAQKEAERAELKKEKKNLREKSSARK